MKYNNIKDRELHRIVATCIIYKNGKYLITRRSLNKKAFPGKWTVPGGGLTIDDYVNKNPTTKKDKVWYFALEDCLRREIEEEVGVAVGTIEYLLDMTFIRPDNVPVITLSFYAPLKKGRVKLNPESIDYAWITAMESEKYDLISGISEEIKTADAVLKNKRVDKKNFFK